ncbi:MAG TPA: hypothetical protein VJB59_10745 [Bdellovibrionota bacterium]|nr:hypothetical protein [Bdellovibrionota bacterium]
MLLNVFEAPLQELRLIIPTIRDVIVCRYANILAGYLAGDLACIRQNLEQLAPLDHLAYWLGKLRLEIRERNIDVTTIDEIQCRARKLEASDAWTGEVFFVLARACEIQENNEQAIEWYTASRESFIHHGCLRKAVKCRLNIIALQSRIHPEHNYLEEFGQIARDARKIREYGTAGLALMNISRELQAAGAEKAALAYANRAVILMAHDLSSLHYYLALIHRCYLYLELGDKIAAREDFERARPSQHKEVQAALTQLRSRFRKGRFARGKLDHLTSSWRGRVLNDSRSRPSFAVLEDLLIRRLTRGPQSRSELLVFLWGNSSTPESAEFRFKRLLQRIRKKRPGFIHYQNGTYFLDKGSHIHFARKKRKRTA